MNNTDHELYSVWANMKARCSHPNNPGYASNKRRGVVVCPSWRKSFNRFVKDMGRRPSVHHKLKRVNKYKGYSKANCYWSL